MNILILASSFSGLCQRVLRELILAGHAVEQHYGMDEPLLRTQLHRFNPELVICPFLTHRIPTDIWQSYRCLIVHPGIVGDRGPSSLDWAITANKPYWGVTLLQAAEEMDAGDIWGSKQFPLRHSGKTSTYKREVSEAAVGLILEAIANARDPEFQPRPLDYSHPAVEGQLQDLMRQPQRKIHWATDSSKIALQKLRAADTSPGVQDIIGDHTVNLYGAIDEPFLKGRPGELLAIRYGAVCRATADGAVWIRQLKCKDHDQIPAVKLPAEDVLRELLPPDEFHRLKQTTTSETANDINVDIRDQVAYIQFDFYNGAASTLQCKRLLNTLREVKRSPVKTIVLTGGEDFFSNGIHLNCIEAAASPADESWLNINAIDDVVLEIINSPNHLTIAALRNNAGAGGAILALACDRVVMRQGVVINPHYAKMGLYGSEYWTYLLPKKVGHDTAMTIATECQPLLAAEAFNLGFADTLLDEDWHTFHNQLFNLANMASSGKEYRDALFTKQKEREQDEAKKPLATYRHEELQKMHATFYDPDSSYHLERRLFVYKGKLPAVALETLPA